MSTVIRIRPFSELEAWQRGLAPDSNPAAGWRKSNDYTCLGCNQPAYLNPYTDDIMACVNPRCKNLTVFSFSCDSFFKKRTEES